MSPTIVSNADQLRITKDMTARQILSVMQKRHSAGLAAMHHDDAFDPAAFGKAAAAWAESKDYYQSYDPEWIKGVLSGRLERGEVLMRSGDSFGVQMLMEVMAELDNHPNIKNARVF